MGWRADRVIPLATHAHTHTPGKIIRKREFHLRKATTAISAQRQQKQRERGRQRWTGERGVQAEEEGRAGRQVEAGDIVIL